MNSLRITREGASLRALSENVMLIVPDTGPAADGSGGRVCWDNQ